LLRGDLGFKGVVVSECLEMEALSHNIGVGGGTVMAVKAGCDIVLLCRSFSVQQEAINGLKLGVENGMISKARIRQSLKRVLEMKSQCTSWEQTLNPGGITSLTTLQPSHTSLSTKAYNNSITVVRPKSAIATLKSYRTRGGIITSVSSGQTVTSICRVSRTCRKRESGIARARILGAECIGHEWRGCLS
jgi:beta-N-acetylhexosaminidase